MGNCFEREKDEWRDKSEAYELSQITIPRMGCCSICHMVDKPGFEIRSFVESDIVFICNDCRINLNN